MEIVEHARELRRAATLAERKLWPLLRDRRLHGLKFRRQVPISHHYIADFCCIDLRLVVELDGAVHREPHQVDHDENRDTYLNSLGYTVLRFPNAQALQAPETVLSAILAAAEQLRPHKRDPKPG